MGNSEKKGYMKLVKTFNIIRKVDDPNSFEAYFIENILPLIFKTASLQVKITKVIPLSRTKGQTIEGIQFIIESYYDSLEVIDQTVHSKAGQKLMEKSATMPGELSVFIGQEKFISSLADSPDSTG